MKAFVIVGAFVVFLLLFLARSAIKRNERIDDERGYKEKKEIAAQKFKEGRESRKKWFWDNEAKDIPESYLSSLLDLFCGDKIDLDRVVSLLGELQKGELYYEDNQMPERVESSGAEYAASVRKHYNLACEDAGLNCLLEDIENIYCKYIQFVKEHYIFAGGSIKLGALSDALKNTYWAGYTVGYFLQNEYSNYNERFNQDTLDAIWEKGDWNQDLKRVFEVGVKNGCHCWFVMWTGM